MTALISLSGVLTMALLAGCSEYKASTASATGLAFESGSEGASAAPMEPPVASPREVETRMRPVAAAVKMSGTPQVGIVVSGTYRWMADWPETESVHLWEAAAGPTRIRVVGRAREMMPSAGLRGVRIRYCVKPAIGEGTSRLTGHKTCSAWTTVDGPGAGDTVGSAG
ncbi:hypothetical protein AB870_00545 [Pandoraea faecigallinarum]|uniref:Uncharacterized protein n=1 Tax=Pandoraea faecigallinarum TaxID=656179 RepID=A0A0H3WNQ2_9BURK|nr:hypothetical protein [Pandoraea faecigallinarum]AKM28940.1 hypothetical protein AB870_00545 [Pandoraea faecigallinarum]